MVHKILITHEKGKITGIHASGDTEVILVTEGTVSKLEPDSIFRVGESYKLLDGWKSEFVKIIEK